MQYWAAGRRGQIPEHMCDIVKFLSKTTCGCDIEPPVAALQAQAIDMIGGKLVEGREPIRVPKNAKQAYAEEMINEFMKQSKKPLN